MKFQLPSEKTIVIVSLSLLAVITFLVTLLVLIHREGRSNNQGTTLSKNKMATSVISGNNEGDINPDSFIISEPSVTFKTEKFYFMREQHKKWSKVETDRYWHPMREALEKSLKNEVEREIGKIFSSVSD